VAIMRTKIFTTYEVAKFCDVHHTTVINWVNEGKLKAYTTPGAHRRIKKEDLVEFLKIYNMPIPEELIKEVKNVLVVDDDIEAVREYVDALSGNGFNVDYAYDGFGAGRKIYKERPDLIVLDFKMPGVDGFQVCESLHLDPETRDIPIIAVTVLKSDEDIKRIKKLGVKEYMQKPIDIEKLLALIKDILQIKTPAAK
jgi:excisionase family DNA binding protein